VVKNREEKMPPSANRGLLLPKYCRQGEKEEKINPSMPPAFHALLIVGGDIIIL